MKKRVLQGMRPTGRLHLGNYLGTAKGMLALQEDPDYETYYMVADLHATTTPFDPKKIKSDARSVIMDYLSVGLDPKKSILFQQSQVPEHAELAFYFSSVVTVARMQHLPTFKEKVKQHPDNVTMALLNYPILMAADILLYKASMVPVGLDQESHMEVTREIARKMNEKFGTDFPEPQRFKTKGEYIPSLTGMGKMSKSVEDSYISLADDLETIKKKLAKVSTDSGKGIINTQEGKKVYYSNSDSVPHKQSNLFSEGVAALLKFVELFQGEERRSAYESAYQNEGIRYGDLKSELAEAIYKELQPIQERRKYFEDNPEDVYQIIREGNEKARKIASETVREVRQKMGLT